MIFLIHILYFGLGFKNSLERTKCLHFRLLKSDSNICIYIDVYCCRKCWHGFEEGTVSVFLTIWKVVSLPSNVQPTSCLALVKRALWLSRSNKDALLAMFFGAIWFRAVASHPNADFLVLDEWATFLNSYMKSSSPYHCLSTRLLLFYTDIQYQFTKKIVAILSLPLTNTKCSGSMFNLASLSSSSWMK